MSEARQRTEDVRRTASVMEHLHRHKRYEEFSIAELQCLLAGLTAIDSAASSGRADQLKDTMISELSEAIAKARVDRRQ
jgi:hypothetical protein